MKEKPEKLTRVVKFIDAQGNSVEFIPRDGCPGWHRSIGSQWTPAS